MKNLSKSVRVQSSREALTRACVTGAFGASVDHAAAVKGLSVERARPGFTLGRKVSALPILVAVTLFSAAVFSGDVVSSTGAVPLGNNVANLDLTVFYAPNFTLGDLGGSDKIYFSLGGYASDTFGNVQTGVYDEHYKTTFDEVTANNGSVSAVSYGADHTDSTTLSGGGDIALYAIPEPGTWPMFFGGVAMLGLWQRVRRRLR